MIARTVIRRGLRLLALALAVVLALGGLLAAALRIQFTGAPAAWAKSTGNDALWLGHAWVDGRRTEQDVQKLAVRLRTTGIKDVYVHSGPFEWDGRLDPAKYPNAGNFVQWMRKHLPGIRISAWLGQAVKNGLDLDDAASRANVLAGVAAIMKQGYDGIHYNFEPIGDDDAEFLDLLDRTRQHTRLLSTSTPQIEPFFGMRLTARAVLGHDKYWSEGYFRQVVDRVDQVAIMTYDSFTPSQSLYGGYVARQARLALDLVPDSKALYIGAPAYHDHGVPWLDQAESVAMAAEGARLALSDHGRRERFGLALYVDFAATEEDWREYMLRWR
ncbi:glycoside hydrolase family 18 protein [Nonomuraea sp. PA05]|uniref:glycoside hydrolase family 18 protein n=1 Tax=Nonomuraea sp. PA05 TaxID=2604466 RepID=UPI0011D4E0E5|nr:glycoside hydrolase family 18 protein [Nonomuraea sp. PA05]TYB58581.1 glycoside hydrolase family 18 protein [Nonomuraea sp. PA05]